MGAVNRNPEVREIIKALEKRVKALESSRRFTIPVVSDWTFAPENPQSGDLFQDASTGFVFVFCVDGNTTSSALGTVASGAVTLTVAERKGFKPYQSVTIQDKISKVVYLAVVQSSHSPATGAGTVPFTFVAPLVATPSGVSVSVPADGTVINQGSLVRAGAWRQLITATDLITKQAAIAAGTLSTSSFSGQNSTVGSNTGGMGERVAFKGYPPHS